MLHKGSCIAHDSDWQFPAITEQHAYHCALELLPPSEHVAYLAFPWATLIDQLQTLGRRAGERLLAALDNLAPQLSPYRHVLTVCQHIRALQYIDLFERAGVTDLYWSHATNYPVAAPFHLHPFPLFPVQRATEAPKPIRDRSLLFSFVGARANQWYLTQARNHIIDLMHHDSRGIIIARDQWHFNKVVYDHQIRKTCAPGSEVVNRGYTDEYRRILGDSVFSLCPSGTGPNSIRLWESIEFGAIPVILADSFRPPGPAALWEQAAVWCDETPDAIRGLADRLESIRDDTSLLQRKLEAAAQIRALYGPDNFIYDLQCRTIDLHAAVRDTERVEQELPRSEWLVLGAAISRQAGIPDRRLADLFLQSTTTRILTEGERIRQMLRARSGLAGTVRLALRHGDESRVALFWSAAKIRRLDHLLEMDQ